MNINTIFSLQKTEWRYFIKKNPNLNMSYFMLKQIAKILEQRRITEINPTDVFRTETSTLKVIHPYLTVFKVTVFLNEQEIGTYLY